MSEPARDRFRAFLSYRRREPALLASELVLIALLAGCDSTPQSDHSTAAAVHSTATAYSACQEFVKERLYAPVTAQFPSSRADKPSVSHRGGGVYDVEGDVDSETRFGTRVRAEFTCAVVWQSGTTYTLQNLTLGDD